VSPSTELETVLVGDLVLPAGAEPAANAGPGARAIFDWLSGFHDSPNTLRAYSRVIDEWAQICAAAEVPVLAATRPLVERYKAWLYDSGRKPSTVNHRLSTLASFYRYAEEEELVRRNPVRGVRRPRLPEESTSTGLARDELNAFLTEARNRGPMTYALMLLLSLNGLRASEPCGATVEDLGTERGHRTLAVVRKGTAGTVRVPLAPATAAAIDDWLERRAVELEQLGRGSGLLFQARRRVTGEHRPIDRRDVHRWVRAIGRAAVPAKPSLHPHDLRHAFVTLSLDAGVPLRDVQDSAGHASANTTRRYDRARGKIDRHATYTLATYLASTD
jgi:integrase/recombinase XerD